MVKYLLFGMLYILDWITCCSYMALSKIRYIDWDMESSAIINSGVVLGNLFIAISSILLQFLSPDKLQFLYNNGKIYWISMYALAIIICMLRYYCHSKNALSSMVEEFKRRGWGDKGLFLFFVSTVLLIASFAILFLISQYLKKQGIANHGDF